MKEASRKDGVDASRVDLMPDTVLPIHEKQTLTTCIDHFRHKTYRRVHSHSLVNVEHKFIFFHDVTSECLLIRHLFDDVKAEFESADREVRAFVFA